MKIVCPYAGPVDLRVWQALDATGFEWEPVDVGHSDDAYWELLSDLWRAQRTFVVVEHDIVVGSYVLHSFDVCPNEFCQSAYNYFVGTYHGLGCVKVEASLTRQIPDLMDRVARRSNAEHPPKHFCTNDAWIQLELQLAGIQACHRHGRVVHLNTGLPSHGCIPDSLA